MSLLRWLVLLPIPVIWSLASQAGWLDFLENKLLDWRFRARGEIAAPVKVVYVDVDSESTTDLGNWPWDRGYFAEVCQALLSAGGVKAIGLDIVFSEKGQFELADRARFQEGNDRLAEFLLNQPPVVVAAGYAASEDRDINGRPLVRALPRVEDPPADPQPPELPEFRYRTGVVVNPPHIGLIDTKFGGTRWVPLFAMVGAQRFDHLALQLARLYWNLPPTAVEVQSERVILRRADGTVAAAIPLTQGQDVEVNWFSHWSSPRHNLRASFVDVLLYARNLQSEDARERETAGEYFAQFRDSVVLIGLADPLMQDIAPTPMDSRPVPRVGIHGNLLKTIVSGRYLQRPGPGAETVLVFALTLAATALAVGSQRSGLWARLALVALLIGYVALAFLLFARAHWVLPLTAPLGAAFTTSFAAISWQLIREERQKSRIKAMFGTYVSPELVDRMVESGEDPKLGGAEVQITSYFSDIQDFSVFSEQLTPPQVVELMNEYLTACTEIITAEGGTLDKYIGDAVVAMFGAPVALPDHAYRACQASVRVQSRLAELRAVWAAEGKRWPATVGRMKTRIGLNTGNAVVGNMGSRTRFNYTMMGDAVNLASRLEGAAKTYGVTTLVTENTKAAAERGGDECVFRFIDRILVKGRTTPVGIYELLGIRSELNQRAKDCAEVFQLGVERYHQRDFAGATALFGRAAELEQVEEKDQPTPSTVYLQRCSYLQAQPPATDWDGVWVMRTK